MNLRALRSLTAWALVAATCATAMADDAKAVKIQIRTRWKAGDVATWTYKDHNSQSITQEMEGQEPKPQKSESETAFVAIARCDEADAEGFMTKGLLWFQRWSREQGPSKDEGLTGAHVELTGKGETRKVKVVTPGMEVTEDAQAWLEEMFGKDSPREAIETLMEPKEPVAVGGTWSPDLDKLAALFGKRIVVDAAKGTMTLKLLSLEGDVARYSLESSLPILSVTGPQGTFNTNPGSALTATGETTLGVSPGLSDSKSVKEQTMKSVITPMPGITVKVDFTKRTEVSQTKGGQMPPVKTADAPK